MAGGAGGCAPIAAAIASLGLLLAGCASHSGFGPYAGAPGDGRGYYRVGRPYEINGVWYYPAVDYNYDKTGIASWYGREFQGRYTANGEIFDMNRLTAADTTLPMPSIVLVTNLQNGRELRLRVNDRGPFRDGRLIDVSRRAAQLLGFEAQGTAPVEVKVLKDASIRVAEEAMHGSDQGEMFVADAATPAAEAPPAPLYRPSVPPPRIAFDAASRPMVPAMRPAPPDLRPPAPAAETMAVPPRLPSPPERPVTTAAAHRSAADRSAADRFAALSRFALIAPAEAAPLPHASTHSIAAAPARTAKPPFSAASLGEDRRRRPPRLYIQAGAFAVRDNARRVESRIASLGKVRVRTAAVNGVELYRVQLGPVASREQADRLLRRVVGSGYSGARIVTD
ncbi:MAG TPA: septal ring lytic transglycosylase RlpA family protein [Stellaceae bacterium]|nr:septal ring lytic transglycosylase RlpA family protein [Stellaceae bacterium]